MQNSLKGILHPAVNKLRCPDEHKPANRRAFETKVWSSTFAIVTYLIRCGI